MVMDELFIGSAACHSSHLSPASIERKAREAGDDTINGGRCETTELIFLSFIGARSPLFCRRPLGRLVFVHFVQHLTSRA